MQPPSKGTRHRMRLRHAIRIRTAPVREVYALMQRIPELQPLIAFEDLHLQLQQSAALTLVAEADHTPAGCSISCGLDERTALLWIGGRLPSYHGCGITAALLQEQECILAERGYRRLRIEVPARVPTMLELLDLEGFVCTGSERTPAGEMLQLEKEISPLRALSIFRLQ